MSTLRPNLVTALLASASIALVAGCTSQTGGTARHSGDVSKNDTNGAADERVVDLEGKRPNDASERRAFTLSNGLEVLLVSDPKFQKSAGAMDVAVGSLEDPWEHLGMAHFLEHMLFLGTEKYPDVDEYSQYISNHQGADNAYTAGENTNYVFQVAHDGLRGTLDRFAQFFVAPLFTPDFVEREMNAVNSEHQKNLQNDFWRMRMIQRALHRDGHPRQKFSTGDLGTLESVTREALLEFHRSYYSANAMKLAVLGVAPLDSLEAWVRSYFADVPNYDRAALEYSTDVYDPETLPRLISVKPVTDTRTLRLEFAAPSDRPFWRSKPLRLLGSLVGYEGKGSLLSQLKADNLATALGASGQTESYASYFTASVELTDKGRANIDRVIDLFFAHIDMLRREGLQAYYFTEQQTMADLDYYFRDHQEGMWTASDYASSMQIHPALEFEKRQSLIEAYEPDVFAMYLDYIRPERLNAMLIAPDVETDQVEPHYGADFSVRKFDAEELARWKGVEPVAALTSPDPNPFIPNDLSLLDADKHDGPYKLVDDERGTFWFEQDDVFKLPKARVSLLLLTEATNRTPRDRLVAALYARAINESMNEWKYDVVEAGLNARVEDGSRGIELVFNGYSQRIPQLISEFAKRLENVTIEEATFGALRDDLAREYQNRDYDQAYQQTFAEYGFLTDPRTYHARQYRDMVGEVTLEEVRAFAGTVLDECAIEGAAYGNLDGMTLRSSVDDLFDTVATSVLPPERRSEPRTIRIDEGAEHAHVFSTKTDNNSWMKLVQFGPRADRREAALRLLESYLDTRFYSELRTRQQLGYVVFSGSTTLSDGQGMYFLIQSGTHAATDCADRAETYLAEALPAIADMDPEEFATMKASLVNELREEDKDMAERLSRILHEGVRLRGDFGRRERVISQIQSIDRATLASIATAAFSPERIASLAIYLDADGAPRSEPGEELIEDILGWRSTRELYPTPNGQTAMTESEAAGS